MNKLFLLAALIIVFIACNNKKDQPSESPVIGTWGTLDVTTNNKAVEKSDRDSVIAAGFAATKAHLISIGNTFTAEDSIGVLNEVAASFDQLFNLRYEIRKDSTFLLTMFFNDNKDTVKQAGRWMTDADMKTFSVNIGENANDTIKLKLEVGQDRLTFIHGDTMRHTMIRIKD